MENGRRALEFKSFDEIMPDVEQLLKGHRTVGTWPLPRILKHLSLVLRRVVDLPASTPHDPSMEVSAEAKNHVFTTGKLPEAVPVPDMLTPESANTAREEADELRAALAHFLASPGPVIKHRLFGALTREEWHRLQLIHCAHHLSFAIPTTTTGQS